MTKIVPLNSLPVNSFFIIVDKYRHELKGELIYSVLGRTVGQVKVSNQQNGDIITTWIEIDKESGFNRKPFEEGYLMMDVDHQIIEVSPHFKKKPCKKVLSESMI